MEVPQDRLELLLSFYKPEYRFLRSAKVEATYARATFLVSGSAFLQNPLTHVTGVETELCLTQLMYAACSAWAKQGKFGRTIPIEEYVQLMGEHVLFVEHSTRFSNPITPNNLFDGEFSEVTMTNGSGMYIMSTQFIFGYFSSKRRLEREAFKGDLKLVFRESTSSII